ncbi:MAG: MFS transporter [Thermotogota bacterium]
MLKVDDLYRRNIKLYYYFRFFLQLVIIGPIIVPFLLMKGLSYSEIMLLQSISAISVVIFEVPTGAIADKISRKFSMSLSGFVIGFALILYIVFTNFFVFVIAEILFGIGLTLYSGADTSLLYESLNKLDRKDEFQIIEGHAASNVFYGQAIGSAISGFLYAYFASLPLWISVINVIIASIIAFGFTEVERKKSQHKYHLHILESFRISFKNTRILWAFSFAAIMGFVFRTTFWLYQPYFDKVNIDVKYFGLIFFFFNVVAAISSKYIIKSVSKKRPRKVLIKLLGLVGMTFIVPVLFLSPFSIIILALQQMVRGLYRTVLRFYINHQIQDEYRATVTSLVSLSMSLSFAIFSPFVGVSLDNKGVEFTYVWMAIVSFGGVVFLWSLRKIQKLKKQNMKN